MAKGNRQKLELTWIGKENRPRLEPRILLQDPEKSYHALHRVSDHDLFDNCLIFGDNLLALKALEQEFIGKIKCIFIDPPYNTGSAFEYYDDGVEHSIWLSMMRDRLEILRRLLSQDGSLWITIDDNEAHYLKVLCDEVLGRANFVAGIAWMKRVSPANDAKYFSSDHDSVLVYAKDKAEWKPVRLPRSEQQDAYYKNPDNDTRGPWNSVTYTGNKTRAERPNLYYGIRNPNTHEIVFPPETLTWRYGPETHEKNEKENLLYWGKGGKSKVPRLKMFLADAEPIVPRSVWLSAEAGSTQSGMVEQKALSSTPFSTPKPELLLQRIIHIASNPSDLVLDSFAGSGTTGAVAHKMGRRWIMIELREHCHTHIVPRLKKVIDGTDPGGITEAVNWKGGGGFRYYRLAPSLLEKDKWGNWVISQEFNAAMLAEALCKLEGFVYSPSDTIYWQHGHSTERDFIYVYHGESEPRPAPTIERRSGGGALAAGRVQRLPRSQRRFSEPYSEEDSQGRPLSLRVGQGRLQPKGGEPPQGPAQAWTARFVWRRGGVMKRRTRQSSKASSVYKRIRQILESAKATAARSVNTTHVVVNWLIGREIVEEEQKGQKRAGYGVALLQSLAARLTLDFGSGFSVHNLKFIRQFYLEYPQLAGGSEIGYALRSQSATMSKDSRDRNTVRDKLAGAPNLPKILYAPRKGSGREISNAVRAKSNVGTISEALSPRSAGGDSSASIRYALRSKSWVPGLLHSDLSWTHYRTLLRVDKSETRAFYEIEAIKNNWSARELERQNTRSM